MIFWKTGIRSSSMMRSTSFYLAREIRNHPEKRIAVVTNSRSPALSWREVGHVELFMIGGYVDGTSCGNKWGCGNPEYVKVPCG